VYVCRPVEYCFTVASTGGEWQALQAITYLASGMITQAR
jgi:hypothetical protein